MIIMFGADKYTICNKNRTIQLNDFKIYACWKACHFRPISFNLYGSLQDVFILIDVFVDKIVSLSDVTLPFFCESKNVKLNKMDDLKMNRKKTVAIFNLSIFWETVNFRTQAAFLLHDAQFSVFQ